MTVICDLVLPCRDEAAALPRVLAGVPGWCRAIVVDNGSSDATAKVAAAHGADVVREPQAGYGAAVHSGITAADADYIAVADGDGSFDLADLGPLLELVRSGAATMAVGRRRPAGRGVWPWHARLGNAVLSAIVRRRTGLAVHDIAPLRLCRRTDLLSLDVRDRRFGYPLELLLRAAEAGWRIVEVDVCYLPRAAGTRSKVSGSVRGTLRATRDFARVLA
ncbi:MAG TPA: glycosyltransferase family 2 protein [Nocardioidaceae bacterium]|nr:glycosyltransferase family 2 protein [Nocardioidaceae bacterium]